MYNEFLKFAALDSSVNYQFAIASVDDIDDELPDDIFDGYLDEVGIEIFSVEQYAIGAVFDDPATLTCCILKYPNLRKVQIEEFVESTISSMILSDNRWDTVVDDYKLMGCKMQAMTLHLLWFHEEEELFEELRKACLVRGDLSMYKFLGM